MKNSNDTIGNRSRDLPDCSAVPQPQRHRVSLVLSVGLMKKQSTKRNYKIMIFKHFLGFNQRQHASGTQQFKYYEVFALYERPLQVPRTLKCITPLIHLYLDFLTCNVSWTLRNDLFDRFYLLALLLNPFCVVMFRSDCI
jgi:hypothetical protein